MPPKSPQPELSHICTHSHCCHQEEAEGETVVGSPDEASSEWPEPKGAVLVASLKRYALWSLAFFGIYASSSVCVF